MNNTYLIGFDTYLKDNLEGLCEEYYGHPQLDPGELYQWDLGFRNYCHEIWGDTVDCYETKKENIYQ